MSGKLLALPIGLTVGGILLFIQHGDLEFLGVALIGLIGISGFLVVHRKTSRGLEAKLVESGVRITGDVTNSNVAGRDQQITYAAPPSPVLPERWWLEENAPHFEVRPNAENGLGHRPNRLTMTFWQDSGVDVTSEVWWIREGMGEEPVALTAENPLSARKKSVRGGTPFEPTEMAGMVAFEMRFRWRSAECHRLWEFPYYLVEKNGSVNLVLDTTADNLQPIRQWRV